MIFHGVSVHGPEEHNTAEQALELFKKMETGLKYDERVTKYLIKDIGCRSYDDFLVMFRSEEDLEDPEEEDIEKPREAHHTELPRSS